MGPFEQLQQMQDNWRSYVDETNDWLVDDDVPSDVEVPDGPCDVGRYELIVMWDDLTPTESELVASALGALVRRRVPGAVSTYIDHMQ